MWRSLASKCAEVALLVLLASEKPAHAHGCCVAPGAQGAARLAPYETALFGVEARAHASYGSFGSDGRLSSSGRDLGMEQSLFATARWLEKGQLTLGVPFLQTWRGAGALSSSGGGVGDVRLSARWELGWLSLLGGVVLPTGTPPERAGDALGAGATGTGAAQGWAGLGVEHWIGFWVLGGSATVAARADRDVMGLRSSLAPRLSASAYGGRAFGSTAVMALALTYAFEGDASIDGQRVPGTSRRLALASLALQLRLNDEMRLVSTVFAHPPIPSVNAGEPAFGGASLALIYALQ
jgi:hypothetical protein